LLASQCVNQRVAGHRTGLNKGKLTIEDIDTVARWAGVGREPVADYSSYLQKNNQMAQTLDRTATPDLHVVPLSDVKPKTIMVLPSAATVKQV